MSRKKKHTQTYNGLTELTLLRLADLLWIDEGKMPRQSIISLVHTKTGRKPPTKAAAWIWLALEHARRKKIGLPVSSDWRETPKAPKPKPIPKPAKPKLASSEMMVEGVSVLSQEFYKTGVWLRLRYAVFEKYGAACVVCGRSKRSHGIILHCDHIKPRSKYPELALTFSNMQPMCEDCNLGKGNRYETDWRPLDEIDWKQY